MALVVDAPSAASSGAYKTRLQITSVAPTILALLGIDPDALQAVQIQHTPVLPGVQ